MRDMIFDRRTCKLNRQPGHSDSTECLSGTSHNQRLGNQKNRHATAPRAEHQSTCGSRGTRPDQARGAGFAGPFFKARRKRQGVAIEFGDTLLATADQLGKML